MDLSLGQVPRVLAVALVNSTVRRVSASRTFDQMSNEAKQLLAQMRDLSESNV